MIILYVLHLSLIFFPNLFYVLFVDVFKCNSMPLYFELPCLSSAIQTNFPNFPVFIQLGDCCGELICKPELGIIKLGKLPIVCKSVPRSLLDLKYVEYWRKTSDPGSALWNELVCVWVCLSVTSHVWHQCRLTLHRLQVLHVQGAGAGGAGCSGHRGEQVGRVGAAVARQQSHLVVVLSRGQTCVRGWSRRTTGSAKRGTEATRKWRWLMRERKGKGISRRGETRQGEHLHGRLQTCVHLH